MANLSRPFGARPTRYLGSAAWNGQAQLYAFSASQANNAYKGDLVQFDATNRTLSLADPYEPGCPCVQPVVAALTTNAFRGVIAGFVPQPEFVQTPTASLGTMFRAASTQRYVWVIDDPLVVFEMEETGNSYTTAANNGINKTADISYVAGSQLTGVSAVVLTGFQTAAVRPWRAVRFSQRPDNFNFSASDTNTFAHFDVISNNNDLLATKGSNGA